MFSFEHNVKNVLEIILRHYIIFTALLCPVLYTCMMLFFLKIDLCVKNWPNGAVAMITCYMLIYGPDSHRDQIKLRNAS